MNVTARLGAPLFIAVALATVGCTHQHVARPPAGEVARAPSGPVAGNEVSTGAPVAGAAQADSGNELFDELLEGEFDEFDTQSAQVADPLGPWNRAMFQFNDTFYFWFLKPVSKAYRTVVPSLARTGVENFFNNLGAPKRFVSNVLQLRGREATIELGKFMINSTWGVLGFGNLFAGKPETKIPDNDLGLTLAHYGVGTGAYVVWPFLGPSTVRDTVGWAGGLAVDPVSYIHPMTASLGARTYSMVNYTSFRIGDYEALKDASMDPYLATRDAYLQYRAEKAKE